MHPKDEYMNRKPIYESIEKTNHQTIPAEKNIRQVRKNIAEEVNLNLPRNHFHGLIGDKPINFRIKLKTVKPVEIKLNVMKTVIIETTTYGKMSAMEVRWSVNDSIPYIGGITTW
jgi:hypothetical protein